VEVVEVRVGDEHEVHQGHHVEVESRVALAFDDAVPLRPVGIDNDGVIWELDKKCGVTDPSDADFSRFWRVGDGGFDRAVAFLKCLRDEPMTEKVVVAPRPSFFGEDSGVVTPFFLSCGSVW